MKSQQFGPPNGGESLGRVSIIGCLVATAVLPIASVTNLANAANLPVITTCGQYLVQWTNLFVHQEHQGLATISKDGHILRTIENWSITGVECRKVTNDSVPDLLIEEWTGGAHCCGVLEVFALSPFKRVLFYDFAYGLGSIGDHFLVLSDGYFDYFEHMCHACSPASVPLVACYDKYKGFKDCTSEHLDIVAEDARSYIERLRAVAHKDPREYDEEAVRGMALGVYVCYLMMGQEGGGLNEIRRAGGGRVVPWLVRHRDLIRQWLASRGSELLKT